MPNPRNDSPAIDRIAPATPRLAWTINGARELGRNVFSDDAQVAGAQRPGGFDEFLILDRQDGSSYRSSERGNIADRDGHQHVCQTGAQRRDDGCGKEHGRNRKQDIHEPHDDVVRPFSIEAGDCAKNSSDDRRHGDGDGSHEQRVAYRPEHPEEYVPSKFVEAEDVVLAGTLEPQPEVLLDHVVVVIGFVRGDIDDDRRYGDHDQER
jgi:hypothetical protein